MRLARIRGLDGWVGSRLDGNILVLVEKLERCPGSEEPDSESFTRSQDTNSGSRTFTTCPSQCASFDTPASPRPSSSFSTTEVPPCCKCPEQQGQVAPLRCAAHTIQPTCRLRCLSLSRIQVSLLSLPPTRMQGVEESLKIARTDARL